MTEPTPATASERARELWQDILEKDDRTSPEEYPDMALITFEEFAANLRAAEAGARRAALEEAAVLVETHSEGHRDGERALFIKKGPGKDAVDGSTYAAGIRALAASSPAAASPPPKRFGEPAPHRFTGERPGPGWKISEETQRELEAMERGRQSAAAASPPDDAMRHLGQVLYLLSDLHPDDRCRALDDAVAFYNAANPSIPIGPSEFPSQRLVSEGDVARFFPAAASPWREIEAAARAVLDEWYHPQSLAPSGRMSKLMQALDAALPSPPASEDNHG